MQKLIGLDVHAASCTLAVVGANGKRLKSMVVETNGAALVEAVRLIAGQRRLCMEEGTQSQWLYEVLSPHVEEIVVVGIDGSRGPKSDERDAFGLAEALRVGAIKTRVHKGLGQFKKLGHLAKTHRMVVSDVVRVQGRIKALYRSWGVPTPGQTVYGKARREEWLSKLGAAVRPAAVTLHEEYDALQVIREQSRKELVAESRRHGITRILETAPGMGPIRVAEMVAIVVTPHRFRGARQLWAYSGLGIVMRSSSDWVRVDGGWERGQVAKTRGLNRNHNPTLKAIFKGAATTVLTSNSSSPLRAHYDRQVAAGTKPNLAKVTLARKIAAITLAMWKHEEVYDPSRHQVHE